MKGILSLFLLCSLAFVIENASSDDESKTSKIITTPVEDVLIESEKRTDQVPIFDSYPLGDDEVGSELSKVDDEAEIDFPIEFLQTTGIPTNEERTIESPPTDYENDTNGQLVVQIQPIKKQKRYDVDDLQKGERKIVEVVNELLDNTTITAAGTGVHNSYTHPNSHGHSQNEYSGQGHAHKDQDHHQQSYVKPLRQSIVHRDPYDNFDQYDVIRTQDYDRQRNHHHQPHTHQQQSTYGHGHGHGRHNSHSHAHGRSKSNFQPYHYDTHLVPQCAHTSRYYHNLTFCLEDHYYPEETIAWAIRQSGHYAQRLLSDITYQSADNLIDGLTRVEEERMTYAHYYGGSHQQHYQLDKFKPPYRGYSYNQDYYKNGGYICPSDIYYARPRRAMNTYGKWKIIVNLDHPPKISHTHEQGHTSHDKNHYHQTYTQTLRLEQCIYSNAPCSYIDSHYYSRCLQKHNFVRLVAWTYEEGLHVDSFKLPIACSCHIQQPAHYYTPQRNDHQTPVYGQGLDHGQQHGHVQVPHGVHTGKSNLLKSIIG